MFALPGCVPDSIAKASLSLPCFGQASSRIQELSCRFTIAMSTSSVLLGLRWILFDGEAATWRHYVSCLIESLARPSREKKHTSTRTNAQATARTILIPHHRLHHHHNSIAVMIYNYRHYHAAPSTSSSPSIMNYLHHNVGTSISNHANHEASKTKRSTVMLESRRIRARVCVCCAL